MTGDKEPESLTWSVRPYEQAPAKRYVILGAALLAMVFGITVYGKPLLGVIGFAIILGATMEFWLGTSYRLDAKGATSRTGVSVSSIQWGDVRRVTITKGGVKLSPLEDATSRLEPFRGVFLKVNEENREQVLESVRKFGGSDVRLLER